MENQPEPLVSDRVLVSGVEAKATLLADGRLRWSGIGHRSLIIEKEVLGFVVEGSEIRIKAIVDSGDGVCCVGVNGRERGLVRKDFVFEPLTDESREVWTRKLEEYVESLGRPKRLFVFLNPFGGKKSAAKIYADEVKPILEDAGVQIQLQETRYQLHAKSVAKSMDLSLYDGIVCVSGDGILVEVVNGLLEREDWKTAIQMPIGMIPAGTGNGMVKSLLDSVGEPCTPLNASLSIIRGHKRKLDVATIMQKGSKFFSVLMLAWGLVADIDIESEKYRWMGSLRIDFYALQRIFHLRQYNGHVSFVPAPGYEDYGEPLSYESVPGCEMSDTSEVAPHQGYQGPDIDLGKLNWRTISGPFVSIWLHNVPWGAEDTMAAPNAKFSDGYLDLIVIKDCPRVGLMSLMTELSNGGHVKSPYVTYLKVKVLVLKPGPRTADSSKEGIIDSDGEVLARGAGTYKAELKTPMSYDKLQITIDQGLATIFAPI
uniref:sphingosine kinase n=1 Tax=Kalanchoe fedtschenkoi TaxID=63787 RepID=A0A7N0V086_KALFE